MDDVVASLLKDMRENIGVSQTNAIVFVLAIAMLIFAFWVIVDKGAQVVQLVVLNPTRWISHRIATRKKKSAKNSPPEVSGTLDSPSLPSDVNSQSSDDENTLVTGTRLPPTQSITYGLMGDQEAQNEHTERTPYVPSRNITIHLGEYTLHAPIMTVIPGAVSSPFVLRVNTKIFTEWPITVTKAVIVVDGEILGVDLDQFKGIQQSTDRELLLNIPQRLASGRRRVVLRLDVEGHEEAHDSNEIQVAFSQW